MTLPAPWSRDAEAAISEAFAEHAAVVREGAQVLAAPLGRAAEILRTAFAAGRKVLVAGNGGSAADAQHFAAELVGGPDARAAVALTTDASALTAIANDHGYAHVFARQLRALAQRGDVFVAISTSGASPSVVEAARAARGLGCAVIGLTGAGGGALGAEASVLLAVPSRNVGRIQEVHILCLHILAASLDGGGVGDVGVSPVVSGAPG